MRTKDREKDTSSGTDRSHDLVFTREDGTRSILDVTIRAIKTQSTIPWPTESDITSKADSLFNAPNTRSSPHFHWEDHSGETICPEVARGRALRALSAEAAVTPTLAAASAHKIRQWRARFGEQPNQVFTPVPFTPGGGQGPEVAALLSEVFESLGRNTPAKIRARRHFREQTSCALVAEGYFMACRCRPSPGTPVLRRP